MMIHDFILWSNKDDLGQGGPKERKQIIILFCEEKVITVHKNGLSNTWLLRIFLFWTFVSKMTYFIIVGCAVPFFLSFICQYLLKSMPDYYPETEILMLFYKKWQNYLFFAMISPKTLQCMYIIYIYHNNSHYIDIVIWKTPFDDDEYHIFILCEGLIYVMAIE